MALVRPDHEPAGHETAHHYYGKTAPPPGDTAEPKRGQLT